MSFRHLQVSEKTKNKKQNKDDVRTSTVNVTDAHFHQAKQEQSSFCIALSVLHYYR